MTAPILFIVFNRPETTRRVFESIRQAKPAKLFVAADGPRADRPGEKELCEEVRKIATQVDWDCQVQTLFRKENRGCGRAPSEAITWFFEHVEQGIILEDDCLPDPGFFDFCDELLDKYRAELEVVIISGFNPLLCLDSIETDYIFTRYGGIWGWATWRRAWKIYKFDVPEWKEPDVQHRVLSTLSNEDDKIEMKKHLDGVINDNRKDFWDFQWWFYRLLQNGLGIVPKCNLIRNIGFGTNATHTFNSKDPAASLRTQSISFPLKHPTLIKEHDDFKSRLNKLNASSTSWLSLSKLKKFLKIFFLKHS